MSFGFVFKNLNEIDVCGCGELVIIEFVKDLDGEVIFLF